MALNVYPNFSSDTSRFTQLLKERGIWKEAQFVDHVTKEKDYTGIAKYLKLDGFHGGIDEELLALRNRINDNIFHVAIQYCKGQNIPKFSMDLNDCNFNRYLDGDYIKEHRDVYPVDLEKDSHRLVTCLLILDVCEEGGELWFPIYNALIKPEPNTLYVFPSDIVHEVKPIIRGERMSYSIWLHN